MRIYLYIKWRIRYLGDNGRWIFMILGWILVHSLRSRNGIPKKRKALSDGNRWKKPLFESHQIHLPHGTHVSDVIDIMVATNPNDIEILSGMYRSLATLGANSPFFFQAVEIVPQFYGETVHQIRTYTHAYSFLLSTWTAWRSFFKTLSMLQLASDLLMIWSWQPSHSLNEIKGFFCHTAQSISGIALSS